MDEQEARRLARQIEGEGWHARVQHNVWSGEWSVWAWQGEGEEAEENGYSFRFRSSWYKVRQGLREEAEERADVADVGDEMSQPNQMTDDDGNLYCPNDACDVREIPIEDAVHSSGLGLFYCPKCDTLLVTPQPAADRGGK